MLGGLYVRNASLRGSDAAIFYEGRAITHAQFARRANRLAKALRRLGVKKGDRVAILAQNCPEYMETYAAGEIGGWITVPINYRLAAAEIAYILSDSAPKVLILEEALGEKLPPPMQRGVEHVVTFGEPGSDSAYEGMIGAESDAPIGVRVAADDVAQIIYTSGTTGRPKGVMHTHGGQMQSALISALEALAKPTDRFALTMPLYHIGAKNLWLLHATQGCAIVLHRAFRPAAFLDSLHASQANATLLAPTMLLDFLDACERDSRPAPAMTKILYSAAAMPESLLRRAMRVFGPIFIQIYGMTESGGPGCVLHAHQHILEGPEKWTRRLRSAGQPMIGCEAKIVRSDGAPCDIGEVGEIMFRSACLMQGYWNNHVASSETLEEGWLHTGDLGQRDVDGFIFVVDRLKDMIISGGENIYSREVENALSSHPDVQEAAVVGKPHERWGETVAAFVVLKQGSNIGPDQLIEHCRNAIASYKRPRDIFFVDELPKLPNGKIEKYKLRLRFEQSADSTPG